MGFVRAQSLYGTPHLFNSWHAVGEESEVTVELTCTPLAKRRSFLGRLQSVPATSAEHRLQSISAEDCTVDLLPFEYARFGLFIPAILQYLEGIVAAEEQSKTILRAVPINDLRYIVTAISAPSVGWISNC